MFVIRRSQMAVLEQAALDNVDARVGELLRRAFPTAAAATPEELALFVARASQDAERLGFTSPQQVCMYAAVAWALGADFVTRHRLDAPDGLLSARFSSEEKMRALEQLLTAALPGA
ncbi:hypothetical protein [Pyxidicoccus caerfyrddinensis]|uniref:hypothetical protein n=1 Tax=Pyxidicoccus caerfyrddinensis TaxID=2709663 RepID=UPI0013DA475A|nr:hypothetical protein [Pyxidicoccus caerfyrddinensis]